MGQQEWDRAVAFESYERQRNAGLPELVLPASQAEQVDRQKRDEAAVRKYLDEKGFLTFRMASALLEPAAARLPGSAAHARCDR